MNKIILGKLTLLNAGKFIKLSPEQNETIVIALANGNKDNISLAYNYAKKYPENEIAISIIEKYHKEFPIEIQNSSEDRILTTENKLDENGIDARKSMFNSYQESEFFIVGIKSNRHIIFYRTLNKEYVEITRILHERMDLKKRISE